MNNEISQNIIKESDKFHSFTIAPKENDKNFLLGSVLDNINDINLTASKFADSDYKRFRLSLLILHLKVLQEFDRYYMQNYKPSKKYVLNLMPPLGAIDGPVFGTVDPSEIKNESLRKKYEKDLAENESIGKEIAFQSELKSLELKLSMYNNKIGVISDSLNFISHNYTNSTLDQAEVKRTINDMFHGSERETQILKSLCNIKNK